MDGLLSIPEPSPEVLSFHLLRNDPLAAFKGVHPTLWIFAYEGLSSRACLEHLQSFLDGRQIDASTRGRICVVVNRKYTISYHVNESTAEGGIIGANTFHVSNVEGDDRGYPLARLTNNIGSYMDWLGFMSFSFAPYFK